ncbi:MAG TPA: class I SAM-dependent methyltransferase [Chitinivibrionales bacterium]|nr:class I SAM-dependent methyltransferase [Chitinivibrionales bacterium]
MASYAPAWMRQWRAKRALARLINTRRKENTSLSAKQVFARIYDNREWGGGPDPYSGTGSDDAVTGPYCVFVGSFIAKNRIAGIVDLGCGDFRVGARIARAGGSWIAVDIVEKVIEANRKKYAYLRNVSFECRNIIDDDLPPGQLCLVRQVLQHLSNAEIASIVQRLRVYEYTLVTEHFPADTVRLRPNRDKPHGFDTRVHERSAVVLDKPPFCVPGVEEVLSVRAAAVISGEGETIRTFLVRKW